MLLNEFRIDNSGRSVPCSIGLISENAQSTIGCDTSNDRTYFSASFYISNISIIIDSMKINLKLI